MRITMQRKLLLEEFDVQHSHLPCPEEEWDATQINSVTTHSTTTPNE